MSLAVVFVVVVSLILFVALIVILRLFSFFILHTLNKLLLLPMLSNLFLQSLGVLFSYLLYRIFRDNLFSAWNQVDLGSSTASEDWLTEALPLLQVFADFSQGDLLLPFLLLLLLLL